MVPNLSYSKVPKANLPSIWYIWVSLNLIHLGNFVRLHLGTFDFDCFGLLCVGTFWVTLLLETLILVTLILVALILVALGTFALVTPKL